MTYRFMRIVDDSIGMFLCRLIGFLMQLKALVLPYRRKPENEDVRQILVQKYFGMGSIINAKMLIKVLRRTYPHAKITFITTPAYREVLMLCGLADEVLLADFSSMGLFYKSLVRIFVALSGTRFDISVDLEFFAKFPMLISALSLAPARIGLYHRKVRPEGILTHKVYYNFYRHISEIYLSYAVELGIRLDAEDHCPSLPSMRAEFEDILRSRFRLKASEKLVVVNVNSGDLFSFRRWPAQSFVSLLDLIMDRHPDLTCVLVGSGAEHDYVSGIAGQVEIRGGRLLNCAGQTTLRELFALIEMSFLVITNDSGPLHIAAYYGKNIVAFFGPETPVVYGPLNRNSVVFYPDHIYCSPCMCVYDSKKSLYAETCEKNICLSELMPEQVLNAIEDRFLKGPDIGA